MYNYSYIYIVACTVIPYNHYCLQALCLGVLIASAVALSTTDDIFAPGLLDDPEDRKHSDKYREIGWMLLGIGIAGAIIQVFMAIIHFYFYVNSNSVIKEYFVAFACTVSLICDPE